MDIKKGAVLALLLVGLVATATVSAQSFTTTRTKGSAELKFLAPVGGQTVLLSLDGQVVGTLPVTIYVQPGPHQFTFSAGDESKTLTYPVKGDTIVPSLFSPKTYPLTVTTNVPGATLQIDDKPVSGSPLQVTAGQHTLTVSANGYLSVTLPFTQPAQANILNVTLAPAGYALTVSTNVPAASFALDGKPFAGNTVTVSPGPHTLTVSATGYQTLTLPFTQPAQANFLNVTLMASTYPLTVTANVPAATFAVDGVPFAGNTTSVSAGQHTLTVTANGYQALTLPFTQPAQSNLLNVTLLASTYPLTVTTNVPGASLALDGQPFGGTISTTAGAHTLTVAAPGYQTVTLPFTQPAQSNTLNVTLQALTGTLTVNVDRLPKTGAAYRVLINNAEVKGGPQTLPPGNYTVRVASGNLSLETTVVVGSGQNLTLSPSVLWETR